ncbi:alpha-L-glutamate ligase [Candidatus Puniceispirillum sp.]|nr:alpha-L-glutamate ligase [Candidatus Puniceispirillum sp.]
MPITYANASVSEVPSVYVIHENSDWTAPLFVALNALGVAYHDWNLAKVSIDLSKDAPIGVFYNRMSASSHTRGNRFAPEITAGVLAWLEGQGRCVINGRQALHLEISKMIQYAALRNAGLNVPQTAAATTAEDIIDAFSSFEGKPVITKHNRAGKGLGVKLFRSKSALTEHVNGEGFDPSVDGITLVQRYIVSPEKLITRVEFVGREFVYAVRVDTSNGFELCPADVCALDASTCMADAEQRFAFDIDSSFSTSTLGQSLIPKMQNVMAREGLDVAAFEFITDEDGVAYVYDINTNTNYNSDAEQRAGISAMAVLASYLDSKLGNIEVKAAA